MTRILLVVCGMCAGLAPVAPAGAHQPWFNSESPDPNAPFVLRTPLEISQVVYGGFTESGQVDFYAFSASPGFPLDTNLVTDDDAPCYDFRPAFTIIGPGIESQRDIAGSTLPGIIPAPAAGEGAATIQGDEREAFYERFARVTFVRGPELAATLPGGSYLVAVFDPAGGAGVYGLTLGGDEVIGGDPEFFVKFGPWSACQPVRGADPWDPWTIG